jgi:cellulose synthase/poly-beta-1,6-N-acetylglucosamine synthase-like glycosyltransferase
MPTSSLHRTTSSACRSFRRALRITGRSCPRTASAPITERIAIAQAASHACGIPAASGSNLLIRRDALESVGGFDFDLTCNEDSEVVWRLRRAGYRVSFRKDLVVQATDHRRLEAGRLRKTLHSMTRCALLYTNLMPRKYRTHDWGYWQQRDG